MSCPSFVHRLYPPADIVHGPDKNLVGHQRSKCHRFWVEVNICGSCIFLVIYWDICPNQTYKLLENVSERISNHLKAPCSAIKKNVETETNEPSSVFLQKSIRLRYIKLTSPSTSNDSTIAIILRIFFFYKEVVYL